MMDALIARCWDAFERKVVGSRELLYETLNAITGHFARLMCFPPAGRVV